MKPPKTLIVIGIILFVLGNVLHNFLPTKDNFISNSPIGTLATQVPSFLFYFLIIFLLPILEEMGFRAWQLNAKVYKFLSVFIVVSYFYFYTSHALSAIIAAPLLYLFHRKNNRRIRIYAILVTSFLFALLHLKNFENTYSQIIGVTTLLGFSFILNYVTWRFSIIWAFLLHFLNNGVAILINKQEQAIQTSSYSITVEQKLINHDTHFTKDTTNHLFKYSGSLVTFVNVWLNEGDESNPIYNFENANNPNLKIAIQYTHNSDRQEILDTILNLFNVKLEKVQVVPYVLSFPQGSDTISIVENINDKAYYNILSRLKNTLSYKGIFIEKEIEDTGRYVLMNYSFFNSKNTQDDILNQFKKHGFELTTDSSKFLIIQKLINK